MSQSKLSSAKQNTTTITATQNNKPGTKLCPSMLPSTLAIKVRSRSTMSTFTQLTETTKIYKRTVKLHQNLTISSRQFSQPKIREQPLRSVRVKCHQKFWSVVFSFARTHRQTDTHCQKQYLLCQHGWCAGKSNRLVKYTDYQTQHLNTHCNASLLLYRNGQTINQYKYTVRFAVNKSIIIVISF